MGDIILKGVGIKKWLAIAVVTLLVIGAVVYINRIRVSADVNTTGPDFLSGIQDRPDLNDPTIIKFPDTYSNTDVQKAMDDQALGNSDSSSGSKSLAISSYIKTQEDKIAKSLPLKPAKKGQLAMNDLVFRVADSKGKIIIPSTGIRTSATKIKTVADNFTFDPTVTQKEKDLMIQAYPIIESIYGSRQNTRKITVFHNVNLNRGYYSPYSNHIELDNANRTDEPIHELVHAFHGHYCLNSLWEEGSAVFVTTYVEKQMALPTDEYGLTQWGYNLNYENLPSTYDSDIWGNAWGSGIPYAYGSMILDKILMENPNYFKQFNQQLYAGQEFPSRTQVLRMAINSVSKVEGEASFVWFSHQYPYIEYYQSYGTAVETYYSDLANTAGPGHNEYSDGNRDFEFTIYASYKIDSSDFDVQLLDAAGNILVDTPSFDTADRYKNRIRKIYRNPSDKYLQYYGLVYVQITPTTNPTNKQTFSFLKTDEAVGNEDVLTYSKTGDIAVFSTVNETTKAVANRSAVAKSGGYFSFKSDWIHKQGRYKVEIYAKKADCTSSDLLNCLGARVDQKYFDKGLLYGAVYLNLGKPNDCNPANPVITSLNRSLSFGLTTSSTCGEVVSLNGVPMIRSWGKSFAPVLPDLAKNTKYNYQISYASNISKPLVQSGSKKTSSYADFTLLSSKSYGDPMKNNFYQRLTFGSPYDPQSLKLILSDLDYSSAGTQFTLRQVSDKVVDVVPSHTYNNFQYFIGNLYRATDTHGNPLYNLDFVLASFSTPMNPLGAPRPAYSLSSDSYHVADSIIISKNFNSNDLASQLSKITLIREVDLGECDNTDPDTQPPCANVPIATSIVNNQVVVKPTQSMIAGKNYWLSMPNVVDDNNNAVIPGWGNTLNFTVN